MKKNFLYSFMALCICLFAACSQEEIIPEASQGGKTVNMIVGVPGGATTRALPSVDGKILRCIMQVVDANNAPIAGDGMRQALKVETDKVTFTFKAPEGDYKCVFWADFVADVNTDNIYTTTDLTNITYKATGNDVFSAAADAYCGYVANGSTTIQLKRPFAKVSVTPNSAGNYAAYNKLTVSYDAPSGFNIVTKTVSSTSKQVTYTNTAFEAAKGAWFTSYIFAASNMSKLNSDITMKLEGENGVAAKTLTIAGDKVPLTENYEINGKFDAAEGNNVDVEVGFDDSFIDPNAPVAMKIGDYINKDGSHSATYDSEKAIGIVFALSGKTDASQYGADKTIAGYAMGLTSTPRTPLNIRESESAYTALPELTNTSEDTNAPWIDADYNGYAYTAAFETTFKDYASPLLAAFETWKGENAFSTAANLSAWYIPSSRQLADLMGAAYGYDGSKNDQQVTDLNIPAIAKNDAVATAVTTFTKENSSYFGSHTSSSNILSSFIRSGRFMCVQTTYANSVESISQFTGVSAKNTAASPFAIRPVLTIFAK